MLGICGSLWASFVLADPSATPAPAPTPAPAGPAAVFSEVWTLVRDNFLDASLRGLDWEDVRRRYGARAAAAPNSEAVAVVINDMLDELRTSHTHYYTRSDPEYYELLFIFREVDRVADVIERQFPDGLRYPSIGLLTESIDGEVFVRGLTHEVGSADTFRVGDRIVKANGEPFHRIRSLEPGKPVELVVQRTSDPSRSFNVSVVPSDVEPALLPTVDLLERRGRSIAHVRIWAWAGEFYQAALEQLLMSSEVDGAEGLILDLREGWGGANPDYLHMFRCDVPEMASIDRNGKSHRWFHCWSKPVVLLINEKTRSGKEIVAYGFRKYGIGPVVGARTAGAVTAGRVFVLSDGSVLYLAVADVLVDGERLEGVGVAPDIEVPFDIRYAAGVDPQLDRAVEVLLERLPPRADDEKAPQ